MHVRIASAALLLASACSSGPWVKPASFAELGGGAIAGMELDTWADLPSFEQLGKALLEHDIDDFHLGHDPRSLRVEGLPFGEIGTVTIEFQDVPEENEPQAPVMAVVARPRDEIALDEARRRFGFELRGLAAFTPYGPVFRTSREPWLAIVEGTPEEPTLGALAVAYDDAFFRYDGHRIPIADADRVAREQPERFSEHTYGLELARAVGRKEAEPIFAVLTAKTESSLAPQLAAIDARFATGRLEERIVALRELFGVRQSAVELSGSVPASVAQRLDRMREQLLGSLRQGADASGAPASYEAVACGAMLVCLERAGTHPLDVRHALKDGERVVAIGRELDAANLTARINRHRDLQQELTAGDPAPEGIVELARRVRVRLADELEQSAAVASAENRTATAACRWLLAYGVRHGARARDVGEATLFAMHDRGVRGGESALTKARRVATKLASRLFPLVSPASLIVQECTAAYDDEWLLADLGAARRLGLTIGDAEAIVRWAVAPAGPETLEIEISPPEISLTRDERTETARKVLKRTQLVSNRPAVAAWVNRKIQIEQAMLDLEQAIELDRYAGNTASGMLELVGYDYAGETHDSVTYRERRRESLASMQRRAESLEAIPEKMSRIDQLYAEHQRLSAERPADYVEEDASRVVEYPRHVQTWKVHATRTARLRGERLFEASGEQDFALCYTRVSADSAKELAAVDEWRTEEDLRADRTIWNAALPAYARMAMRTCFDHRLEQLSLEIGSHGWPEVDEVTERRWLLWLFRDRSTEADADVANVLALQDALVDAAFAGQGEPLPLEPPIWVAPNALADELQLLRPRDDSAELQQLFEEGIRRYEAGEHAAAAAIFHVCVEGSPTSLHAWAYLGGALSEMGEPRRAIEAYRKAEVLDPKWAPARLQVALLYALLDDWDSASREYDECMDSATREELNDALVLAIKKKEQMPAIGSLWHAVAKLEKKLFSP